MLKSSDRLRGYRAIWKILRDRYSIIVPRIVIQKALKLLDPEGVEDRKRRRLKRRSYFSKGPNYIWHVDGYDKLKLFGLTIHGCIDGFSRKIIWLKLASTNSDPKVIVGHYLNVIEEMNGCPKILRVDKGTENVGLSTTHIAMRLHHDDEFSGESSFIYGPSKHNIRIEAWWSQLRKSKTDWWINLLKDWQQIGILDVEDLLHRQLLAFTIGKMLQEELSEFVHFWNTHRIRKNKLTLTPSGIPNDLYDMPELFGTVDHAVELDNDMLNHARAHESVDAPELIDPEVLEVANKILELRLGINRQSINTDNCKEIFQMLITYFS